VRFAFENWLEGSLPVTGDELRPALLVASLLLLAGAVLALSRSVSTIVGDAHRTRRSRPTNVHRRH